MLVFYFISDQLFFKNSNINFLILSLIFLRFIIKIYSYIYIYSISTLLLKIQVGFV